MTPKPEASATILDSCLEAMLSHQTTIEDCLEKYPELENELEGLLTLAVGLRAAHAIDDPDPAYVSRGRETLVSKLRAADDRSASKPAARSFLAGRWKYGFAVAGVLLTLLLLAGSSGVVVASAAALPGDRLYTVKRGIEDVHLAVILDPSEEAHFLLELAEERQSEIQSLIENERIEDLPAAIDSFNEIVGKGFALTTDQPSDEVAADLEAFAEQVAQSLAALERVREKVPPQAQKAIEQAIENAQRRGPEDMPPSSDHGAGAEAQQAGADDKENERIERTAGQIARKYETAAEDVLAIYYDECDQDWSCVRRQLREQVQEEKKNQGQGSPPGNAPDR